MKKWIVKLKNTDQASAHYNKSYHAEMLAKTEESARRQAKMKYDTDHEIGTIYEKREY